jgi:hypothetical protein
MAYTGGQNMDLTLSELQALDRGEAVPLVVEGRKCVLLRDAVFEQLDEWHPQRMQRHLADMMRDDWEDPAMSIYDE